MLNRDLELALVSEELEALLADEDFNDEDGLRKIIEEVVAANPQSVEDYRNGKEKAIGFLVGQTMKATKGKANPGIINKILKELL